MTAAGGYGFTLTNHGTDAVAFSSREGANAPQLVLTFPAADGLGVVAAEPAERGAAPEPPVLDVAVRGHDHVGDGRWR